MNIRALGAFLFVAGWMLSAARAETPPAPVLDDVAALRAEMADLRRQMDEQRRLYQTQIDELKRKVETLPAAAPPAPTAQEELSALVGQARAAVAKAEENTPRAVLGRAFQSFNPDLSVIGDFVGHHVVNRTNNAAFPDERGDRRPFQFRELELAFSSPVDPHSRADFFVALEEEPDGEFSIGLEEGYLTLLALPHDLQVRAGKFRSTFGKANLFHTHARPWVDSPNVIANYFGEEGMGENGVEVTWLVPNPAKKYLEYTLQIQNNANGNSFAGERSDDVMLVNHLKYFDDLSTSTTMELGGSVATGDNGSKGPGGSRTTLEGMDLTFKWRDPRQGLYRSVTWMTEALLSQKDQPDAGAVNSWGAYSSLEYQFARQWSAFVRWDYSQMPDDASSRQHAGSVGVTYAQSEFCFWRVAYKRTAASGPLAGDGQDELWLQLDMGIGPHRAHKY